MKDEFRDSALHYHQFPIPGKLTIVPTKDMATQRDLALIYSPGVDAPCAAVADHGMRGLQGDNNITK